MPAVNIKLVDCLWFRRHSTQVTLTGHGICNPAAASSVVMVTDAECSSVMKPGARSAEQHPQQTTPPPQRAFNTYDVIADTHAVTMATPAAAADDDYLRPSALSYYTSYWQDDDYETVRMIDSDHCTGVHYSNNY